MENSSRKNTNVRKGEEPRINVVCKLRLLFLNTNSFLLKTKVRLRVESDEKP